MNRDTATGLECTRAELADVLRCKHCRRHTLPIHWNSTHPHRRTRRERSFRVFFGVPSGVQNPRGWRPKKRSRQRARTFACCVLLTPPFLELYGEAQVFTCELVHTYEAR